MAKKDSKTDQKRTKIKGDLLRRPRAHGAKRRGFRQSFAMIFNNNTIYKKFVVHCLKCGKEFSFVADEEEIKKQNILCGIAVLSVVVGLQYRDSD